MLKKIIVNPNLIYILSFVVPFIFYSLEWSTLYPPLSLKLFLFYIFTFIVCAFAGIALQFTRPFQYTAISRSRSNWLAVTLMYILYTFEVVYSRKIPLLGLLQGTFDYAEDSFGIPVIHTFLVSFNMFYGIFLFHQYISSKKRGVFFLFLLSILPFVLLVYRSSILSIIIGSIFVFLFSKSKIGLSNIYKILIGSVLVFYAFGMLGNLRSGQGDPTYIPRSSGATEKFLSSSIPKEFYWSYLYIASPVANLQNNINYVKVPEGSYGDLFLNEGLPNFFVKFLTHQEPKQFNQINPFLNVGTIYVLSFSYKRWAGIICMFLYFFLIFNIYYLLITKSDTYKVTGLAILFNIIIFANFHNTISYSASSVQLIFPLMFSLFRSSKHIFLQNEAQKYTD